MAQHLNRESSSSLPLRQASNKESQCKYWLPEQSFETEYSCRYEMMDIDIPYCIFHMPSGEQCERLQPSIREKVIDSRAAYFHNAFAMHIEQMQANEQEPNIDCRGFRFPAYPMFRSFEKSIDFSYAIFEDIAFLPDYTTGTRNPFVFKRAAIFSDSTFNGVVNFSDARFTGDAVFRNVVFRGHPRFESATFEGEVSFIQTSFEQGAYFSSTTFTKPVKFFGSHFLGNANFTRAHFHDTATFVMVRFDAWVNLNAAKFYGDVSFQEAAFNQGAALRNTLFTGKTSFTRASFSQKMLFQDFEFEGDTGLTGVDITKDANITFEKVRLGKVSFEDTNLELINFRDVTWANPHSRFRPFALWDEFRPVNAHCPRDYEKIAENYRQLVINYEKKRDYNSAEIFHIGEMETRRKKNVEGWGQAVPWLNEWFNSYGLYRLLSTYGTSYFHAALVLILFIFISSLLFMYSGFETDATPSRVIEYNITSDSKHQTVTAQDWIRDYVDAVAYSLSIVTFQQEKFYKPTGLVSRLCLYVAVVVLTGQLAMVLLAVRRKFKR